MEQVDKIQLSLGKDSPAINNYERNRTCEGGEVKSSLQMKNSAGGRKLNVCQVSGDLDKLEDGRVRMDSDCSMNIDISASSCPRKDRDILLPDCASNQNIDDDDEIARNKPKSRKPDAHGDVRVSSSEFGNDADINRPKPKPYNFKSKEAQSSKNLGDVRVSTSEFEYKKGRNSKINEPESKPGKGQKKNDKEFTNLSGMSPKEGDPNSNDPLEDSGIMGYQFNADGVFVDADGKPFTSNSVDSQTYGEIAERISHYIYHLMMTDCKLEKHFIPVDAQKKESKSFFFASKNAFTTTDRLLILIHGSGQVRAGMWSRRVIMTHNLMAGSQLPFINKALESGYEVVVLNTNLNSYSSNRWPSDDECIRGSESPEKHALYVWRNFIQNAKAQSIAIVAHSYGGVVILELASEKDFIRRVFAVAFTDSVHSVDLAHTSKDVIMFLKKRARNWVTSSLELDAPVKSNKLVSFNDAPRVSAGHTQHEMTSWSSFESIFRFFNEQFKRKKQTETMQSVL